MTYPYVDEVDPDGEWANLWIETRNGDHLLVRYDVDGSTYYRDDDGDWVLIDDDRLPNLEAVDPGTQTAYFSKVQHHDTVYFSIDDDGDFDWLDQDDIPGYETPPDDEYEYPRVVEYEYGEDAWALIEMEDGRLIKYYDEGGAYWVDEYGNETAIYGFETPTLLYVEPNGDAYFRVFSESQGTYHFYFIDVDGGIEYVNEEDVSGYEPVQPPVDELYPPYGMPPYLEFGDNQYVDPEEAEYQLILPSDPDEDTTHWQFRGPNGELIIVNKLDDYTYQYVWQPDPNVPPGTWGDGDERHHRPVWQLRVTPGDRRHLLYDEYYDEQPPVEEEHPEYFFDDDYPNPFYGDLEPDGPPSFNGATGTYTQTYDNGQIIVTYQNEGGPYRIRWYDEDADGDNYLALDINYDAYNYTYDVYYYPYDYFNHVEDDFTIPEVDHYVDYAYLGIEPDEVDILGHQVQYIWYDEQGNISQLTRVDRATGEVSYQYGPLTIYVDANGNQTYAGTPDPNWAPPEGYEPPPPVDENHEPYFFEDYPNPLYGDLEADGPPSFNGATGTYTQTYDNGQVIVTYQDEDGPYRIRWYDQDEDGDNYLALDLNYDAENYEYDVYRYPIDYFDHVEDDFTLQAIDHYEDLAYLGIPPDDVDILDHQVQYIWYDEDGGYAQITRVDRATGEINYQYGPLFITVDQDGNQSYTGTPRSKLGAAGRLRAGSDPV